MKEIPWLHPYFLFTNNYVYVPEGLVTKCPIKKCPVTKCLGDEISCDEM